jgi:hypothetical protein
MDTGGGGSVTIPVLSGPERAAQAVESALAEVAAGTPGLLVEAAAGAGKTTLVTQMATLASRMRRESVLVAAYTRRQRNEILRRLGRRGQTTVWGFLGGRDGLPADVQALGVQIARRPRDLPQGPSVIVSTVMKAALSTLGPGTFDWLMTDEVYQVPSYLYLPVASLATRHAGVGDPAQIDPVVVTDATRWAADPNGPHRPAPVLLAAHPAVARLGLPVSRRLVADTVRIVGPVFYPTLAMQAIDDSTTRSLRCAVGANRDGLDQVLSRVDAGASLAAVELPARRSAFRGDEGMVAALTGLAARALERGASLVRNGVATPLGPRNIGIVCAHIEQVTLVQAALRAAELTDIECETANRWQGEERALTLVWHPLTGKSVAGPFACDPGRWCVALTRHQGACIVVQREGVEDALGLADPGDPPPLGLDQDPVWDGVRAHASVLESLRVDDRVVSV